MYWRLGDVTLTRSLRDIARVHDFLRRGALEQVTARTGLHCFEDIRLLAAADHATLLATYYPVVLEPKLAELKRETGKAAEASDLYKKIIESGDKLRVVALVRVRPAGQVVVQRPRLHD